MSFRLSVVNNDYEIYGDTVIATDPTGTITEVVIKDVIAKIALTGVLAADLIDPTKLTVSGTTNKMVIVESDELYTVSGMTVVEAKKFFEIKYTFDGATYFNKEAFISALSGLRNNELNNLVLANFKVIYEFTDAGLAKYFSTEVFNDPDAVPANTLKELNVANVVKTLDLNAYIQNVAKVQLSGTNLDIKYANELDTAALQLLGVKIQ
jgi:hypothetical protein